jgi:prevent-host-death family protein
MSVGVFEAKTTLSALLERVEAGEEIVITRRGVPVARLVPPAAGGLDSTLAVLADTRSRSTPGPESLRELIEEGRDR